MAIDAKDQITHGHIRRVQAFAVALAQRMGVVDDKLIRAIEAAALLHDMGKLAVPEYILNKPGRLTPAEFEKMKLHASVGADILSAIDFPYPVVPIVRHHHENWDGSGYPSGLKGTDIPIGARILSVVDCFDALTSDRPYRPRLSDDEALQILKERRGTMYDPLIVDTFSRVHVEIAPPPIGAHALRYALTEITTSSQPPSPSNFSGFDDIAASAEEMLTLYELARALTGLASTADTADVIGKHLRRLVPFSLSVFYLYDVDRDELVAKHAIGEPAPVVKGLRVALGQRLSGWVAANRQTIVNSDPSLDFGEVARSLTPPLRSCISAPLVSGNELVGVLSLYSAISDGFTDEHRRVVEAVARQVGSTFKAAVELDSISKRDPLTGLPQVRQLEQLIRSGSDPNADELSDLTLIFTDIVRLKDVNERIGRSAGDELIKKVAQQIRRVLRVTDILFRYAGDDFVILLHEATSELAQAIADRIRDDVASQCGVAINVVCVAAPADGHSFDTLMQAGRNKLASLSRRSGHPLVH
jgi:diguanylate cyclase (GGDEF)-like protein/putative nucleotidyltransferase with HDIG domain